MALRNTLHDWLAYLVYATTIAVPAILLIIGLGSFPASLTLLLGAICLGSLVQGALLLHPDLPFLRKYLVINLTVGGLILATILSSEAPLVGLYYFALAFSAAQGAIAHTIARTVSRQTSLLVVYTVLTLAFLFALELKMHNLTIWILVSYLFTSIILGHMVHRARVLKYIMMTAYIVTVTVILYVTLPIGPLFTTLEQIPLLAFDLDKHAISNAVVSGMMLCTLGTFMTILWPLIEYVLGILRRTDREERLRVRDAADAVTNSLRPSGNITIRVSAITMLVYFYWLTASDILHWDAQTIMLVGYATVVFVDPLVHLRARSTTRTSTTTA